MMNLSEQLKSPSRVGHLVRQITKEEWPMRLGDWRAVDERCDLLADTASRPAGGGKWTGKEVRALLYQAQIIRYDEDSGLWYCSIVAPKQDYPDGWESQAKLQRMERRKLKAEQTILRWCDASKLGDVSVGGVEYFQYLMSSGDYSWRFVYLFDRLEKETLARFVLTDC